MLVLPPLPTLSPEDEVVLSRFLSLPFASFLERSDAVYQVVCWAPAQHGYPPQVTIANENGLPLVFDMPDMPDEPDAKDSMDGFAGSASEENEEAPASRAA